MKIAAVTLMSVCLMSGAALAQEELVARQQGESAQLRPEPKAPAYTQPSPAIQGIVAQAVRTSQPWQLVNPLAPKKYGNGEEDVSRNPNAPGKPKGFILFALNW